MGLHVNDPGFNFADNNLPIMGRVLMPAHLVAGLRANDPANMLDVSYNDSNVIAGAGVQYAPNGIKVLPQPTNAVTIDRPEQDDDVTIICSGLHTLSTAGVGRIAFLGGTGVMFTDAGGGIQLAVLYNANASNPANVDLVLRVRFRGNTIANPGTYVGQDLTLPLGTNLTVASLNGTAFYYAATIKASTGAVKLYSLGDGLSATKTVPINTYNITAAGRGTTLTSGGLPLKHCIGRGNDGSGNFPDRTVIANYLYFNRQFSDQQIYQQYALDKAWLSVARSITLP